VAVGRPGRDAATRVRSREHLVTQIRALPAPVARVRRRASAQLIDSKAAIFAKLPLALGIIALVTFITLF